MRIHINADDGDQITINVDDFATEQQIIRLEFVNLSYINEEEIEPIEMTTRRAREFAAALLKITDLIEGCKFDQAFSACEAETGSEIGVALEANLKHYDLASVFCTEIG